ncbi:unnamed protein product, partial [Nesidiocoris tenuis]
MQSRPPVPDRSGVVPHIPHILHQTPLHLENRRTRGITHSFPACRDYLGRLWNLGVTRIRAPKINDQMPFREPSPRCCIAATPNIPKISTLEDPKLFGGLFNALKSTIILIPGFNNTPRHSDFFDTMKNAYIPAFDVNLITVFWDAAILQYPTARSKVPNVATIVDRFLKRMVREESLNLATLTVVGHSLGAQIAGTAGRLFKGKLWTVVASCSHARAFELYAETVSNPVLYPATRCSSYSKYLQSGCSWNSKDFMGQNSSR